MYTEETGYSRTAYRALNISIAVQLDADEKSQIYDEHRKPWERFGYNCVKST